MKLPLEKKNMKTIHANTIFYTPGLNYQGNAHCLGELAEKFDRVLLEITAIEFKPQKNGTVKIDVQIKSDYSEKKVVADEDDAARLIEDRVEESAVSFDGDLTVLIDTTKTEFNRESTH